MPTAAQARASSATTPAISRPRSVRPASQRPNPPAWRAPVPPAASLILAASPSAYSGSRLQHVADAADGMDHRHAAAVDLLPQVADVQLHDMRLAAEVVVPHPVQDLRLGQHPPRVAHQEPQQLELGRGQLDQVTGPPDLPRFLVHGEVTDGELRAAARPGDARPAQQAAQPGEHLLQDADGGPVGPEQRRLPAIAGGLRLCGHAYHDPRICALATAQICACSVLALNVPALNVPALNVPALNVPALNVPAPGVPAPG